ncbi:hypothetical protein GCK72_020113 [Caenorhabditis remanei]|uniref:Uncharacterized protein n=1 Tax=Caenorhabditis remanei TaxID=31234 RepID=A0A6A5GFR8_CAERE|nr:hypothetical protein GCK72_020113 [Caenorhabditis remanei]KAF1753556.1 hypothetical protein GCK72_020113 [Caenorhabditis remanei]
MTENTDPLTQYFKNVYPYQCIPDSRFLSSKQGLLNTSRVIALLFLPFQLFTAYCILKKTPENMKSVKGTCPYMFYPYSIGFPIGLLADWGVPTIINFYVGFIVNIVVIMSITMLFENRSSLIARNIFRIRTTTHRFIWIFLNILWFMAIILPPAFHLPDQMEAKMLVLQIRDYCKRLLNNRYLVKGPFFADKADGSWVDLFKTA